VLKEKYGPNKLPEKAGRSALSIFITQFKNPLIYIITAAAITSLILSEFEDAIIIGVVIFRFDFCGLPRGAGEWILNSWLGLAVYSNALEWMVRSRRLNRSRNSLACHCSSGKSQCQEDASHLAVEHLQYLFKLEKLNIAINH
jgi:hypothetical protein